MLTYGGRRSFTVSTKDKGRNEERKNGRKKERKKAVSTCSESRSGCNPRSGDVRCAVN
jgi:hypothetical protein